MQKNIQDMQGELDYLFDAEERDFAMKHKENTQQSQIDFSPSNGFYSQVCCIVKKKKKNRKETIEKQ